MNKPNFRAFAMEARLQLLDMVHRQAEKTGIHALPLQEEAAYTWFSRSIALAYMEANGYPTPGDSLLEKMKHLERWGFAEIPREILSLYPEDLERFIREMQAQIPREAWVGQVQLLGWLYQYYFTQRHDRVVDALRGKAISKEDIPAATQLFTPDWVVRYLVDNSLGRYWLERNPGSPLSQKLGFGIENHTTVDSLLSPEKLTFFDPCMGTGHILIYAFDVLMAIYRECGYSSADAAGAILRNNLFGLDIDDAASQLARFSLLN